MDLLQIDAIQLYFGDPYVINDKIVVSQPTIGDIVKYGEQSYFSMVHTLCATPSSLKSKLWDLGIDWEELSDFELFMMLAPTLSADATRVVLGNVDLTRFKPYPNKQNGEIVLADKENGIVIDRLIYERIVNYLRKAHGLKKFVEYAGNKYTKKMMIEIDRQDIEANKNKPYKSFLMPLISSLKCRMGYTKDYVRNMGIFEFFDDIGRINVIVSSDALLQGMYSGMIDTSKIKKDSYNWMKELNYESEKQSLMTM